MAEDEDHTEELDEDPTEHTNELWRQFVVKASEMAVHFGLFNAVVGQYPDHVRENFNNEMAEMLAKMESEIDFIQNFAEGFDDQTEAS